MFEDSDPVAEAVLTSRGQTVEPDDDPGTWRVVGGDRLSAGDLLARAIVLTLNAGAGRLQ